MFEYDLLSDLNIYFVTPINDIYYLNIFTLIIQVKNDSIFSLIKLIKLKFNQEFEKFSLQQIQCRCHHFIIFHHMFSLCLHLIKSFMLFHSYTLINISTFQLFISFIQDEFTSKISLAIF